MTPRLLTRIAALASFAFVAQHSVAAQVQFYDSFTTSAQSLDVNFELSGRQSGLLAPIPYLDTHPADGGYRTQVNEGSFPNALFLFPESGPGNQQVASPNYSFTSLGETITIGVVIRNQSMEGSDYLGFDVGASSALDLAYQGSGFGLVFRPHFNGVGGQNNFEVYFGSTLLTLGNSTAFASSENFIQATIFTPTFDGVSANVDLSVNGTSIFSGALPAGFTGNYVSLSTGNFAGDNEFAGFDDLTVTVVPEPLAGISLALSLGVLAFRRRRS